MIPTTILQLSPEETLVALLYLVISALYLLVIPGSLYLYLNLRWYVASSIERGFMYFLVFLFFPGLLLLSPFLNFRPKKRIINA
jgi:NAD(P)H-quinone oxidoreductase subunit L